MTDQAIDLHGTVEVPRAALYGFRDFVERFHGETITSVEWEQKMRWLDSLLEQPTLDPDQALPITLGGE